MAEAQPRLGKGQTRHRGGNMNPLPHPGIAPEGGRKRGKGSGKGIPGKGIGDGPCALRHKAFHRVGQNIKTRIGDQRRREGVQQVSVQNGHIRQNGIVHQGVLDTVVGEDCEVCDL